MSEPGICECGCGERTQLAPRTHRARGLVKGQPRRFVMGHQSRGKPQPERKPKAAAPSNPEYAAALKAALERYDQLREDIRPELRRRVAFPHSPREWMRVVTTWDEAA